MDERARSRLVENGRERSRVVCFTLDWYWCMRDFFRDIECYAETMQRTNVHRGKSIKEGDEEKDRGGNERTKNIVPCACQACRLPFFCSSCALSSFFLSRLSISSSHYSRIVDRVECRSLQMRFAEAEMREKKSLSLFLFLTL